MAPHEVQYAPSGTPGVSSAGSVRSIKNSFLYARQQDSLTLQPAGIADFSNNGNIPGRIPSLTSLNNFINFCNSTSMPLTNGTLDQTATGFCAPTPMGQLPARDKMPSVKLSFPRFGDIVPATSPLNFTISVKQMAWARTNPGTKFLAAPQTLDSNGYVVGFVRFVLEKLNSLTQAIPTDPSRFTHLSAQIDQTGEGILRFPTTGLEPGHYRMAVMLRAANGQPVLAPVADRGAFNDVVYFSVSTDGRLPPASQDGSTASSKLQPVNNTLPSVASQTSLSLDPAVIVSSFSSDGSGEGVSPSLTSKNNFINFCAQYLPLTDGEKRDTTSCNPAPLGVIPPSTLIPSSKFTTPINGMNLVAKEAFPIRIAVLNMITGVATNENTTYLAGPQQVDRTTGHVLGHVQLVIQALTDFAQGEPPNPARYAFFRSVTTAADKDGLVSTDVPNGLPDGTYRLSSSLVTANFAPITASIAQHGYMDDAVYFTVGNPAGSDPEKINSLGFTPTSTASTQGPTSFPTNSSDNNSSRSSSTGAVAGGTVGGILVILIVVLVAFFLVRRRRHQRFATVPQTEEINLASSTPIMFHLDSKRASGPGMSRSGSTSMFSSGARTEDMASGSGRSYAPSSRTVDVGSAWSPTQTDANTTQSPTGRTEDEVSGSGSVSGRLSTWTAQTGSRDRYYSRQSAAPPMYEP